MDNPTSYIDTSPLGRDVWSGLIEQATRLASSEPALARMLDTMILSHDSLGDAVAGLLASRLATDPLPAHTLYALFCSVLAGHPSVVATMAEDLVATVDRNPAFPDFLTAFLTGKGLHALYSHRITHSLWLGGRRALALILSAQVNEALAADLHPAANIGPRVFIDHATGVVIGETAVLGADCSILQQVTLGGTGKDTGDRHPKVGRGVLIGAGATILGNIIIGDGARIGAGSVVLAPVPARTTVVGVPAQIVRQHVDPAPALSMRQDLEWTDWSI